MENLKKMENVSKCRCRLSAKLLIINVISGLFFAIVHIQAADTAAVKTGETKARPVGTGTEYDGIELPDDSEHADSKTVRLQLSGGAAAQRPSTASARWASPCICREPCQWVMSQLE